MSRFYKIFNVVICAAAVFIITERAAHAMDCPNIPPQVDVLLYQEPTEYIRNFSTVGLTKLHSGSYRMNGPSILGLGGGPLQLEMQVEYAVDQSGDIACVRPSRIIVDFTIIPVIMISQDYAKGSCEYKAVLVHEQKHVQTFMDFQNAYAPRVKAFVASAARKSARAQIAATVNVPFVQKQMEQFLASNLENYMDVMHTAIQKRQLAVDTPEEYASVAAQCSNW